MENAVEALKTGAAVLVFIIAITLSFVMFAQAKVTADSIITMQDKQEYLEASELDNGILYTSSDAISAGTSSGMTTSGDRIVGVDDVISTIYRYNLEKYGVTIVKSDGTVLARFDSNTENIMRQWYNIQPKKNDKGVIIKSADEIKAEYAEKIKDNISVNAEYLSGNIDLDADKLEKNIYNVNVDGNTNIECGAPWYGNEKEIIKRCNADITGTPYKFNNIEYQGKKLYNELINGKQIIEVVNEIDNSKYLKDSGAATNLLQDYQLPTIEIIYIIQQ